MVRTSRAGSTDPAGCGTDRIPEQADDVQQRVGVAERRDVEQRLRPGLATRHARDIGELDRGRHVLARIEERRQAIEPIVRHARHTDVRLGPAGPAPAPRGRWSAAGRAPSCRRKGTR
jgi:hypothetical protein